MPPALVAISAVAQTAVYAILLTKLFRSGLASIYRAFTLLLFFEPVRLLISLAIPRNSTSYALFYFITQPIQWILYALVTLEVYKSVFRSMTGISKLTRYVIIVATGLAVAVSTLTFGLQPGGTNVHRTLELYLSVERSIFFSLLTFVLILVIFLSWFPIPVHRNAVVYTAVFALFFGVKAAVFLLRTFLGPSFATATNIVIVVVSLTSGLLWTFLLTVTGETRQAKPVVRLSSDDERRLVEQLESINRSLLRSVPDES